VKGRGALLGPEESGQLSSWRDGLVFLGRFHTESLRIRVWCVVGAGSHQTPGVEVLRGVFSPEVLLPRVVVVKGWCSCPYFENCIVDASIFVAILLFLMYV
jgi:hypothetical protein